MIHPGIFFTFLKIWFFGLLGGVKGQKIGQNGKYLHLSCTISQEHYSIWSRFLVHLCKMISLGTFFFFIFLKFLFFRLFEGGGGKGAKIAQKIKNNNCICHLPYPRGNIAYDHDFWYACVKWWYLQISFSFFWNFHSLGC